MPIPGLDPNLCARRNRVAALRDGVEAMPVKLYALHEGAEELARAGLPTKPEMVLASIRAQQPDGATPLEAEQVYAHVMEAANGSFIPDRCMFLADTTLRNIATDGARGIAFMNSHRTGGLSHPSELPFGKSFAGAYEPDSQRSMLAIYMLAQLPDGGKVYPNGQGGPSTMDLDAMIRAGTIGDVSVGLYGGTPVCDVCGEDLRAIVPGSERGMFPEYLCQHMPGSTYGMKPAEIAAQKKRGVPDGNCSYTLQNARMGEVSAVYDGAVPGAGFRKALQLARSVDVGEEALAQCRASYAKLARRFDFAAGRAPAMSAGEVAEALTRFWGDADVEQVPDATNHTAATLTNSGVRSGGAVPAGFTLAPQAPSSEITDTQVSDSARDAESFEAQLDATLAAVSRCLDRGERLRRVSGGRYAQLQALQQRGSELLQTLQPERDQSALRALRLRNLRRRAQMLPTVGD